MKREEIFKYVQTPQETPTAYGRNTAYYMDTLQRMAADPKLRVWNWAAFFFNPSWFMYRRMYSFGITLAIAMMVAVNTIFYLEGNIYYLFLFTLGMMCLMGYYGNALYLKHIQISLANNTPKRGTDIVAVVILLLANMLINTLTGDILGINAEYAFKALEQAK